MLSCGVHSCRSAHVEVMWRSCVGAFMPLCTRGGHVEVMCGCIHAISAHVEVM